MERVLNIKSFRKIKCGICNMKYIMKVTDVVMS